jgi:hypothetical protein
MKNTTLIIFSALAISACASGSEYVPADVPDDANQYPSFLQDGSPAFYPGFGDGSDACTCAYMKDAQGNMVKGSCTNGVVSTVCMASHWWFTCTPNGWMQDFNFDPCDLDAGSKDAFVCKAPCVQPVPGTCVCPDAATDAASDVACVAPECHLNTANLCVCNDASSD